MKKKNKRKKELEFRTYHLRRLRMSLEESINYVNPDFPKYRKK